MTIKILPSKISGTIMAPSSKSATHRAIILASLASGTSVIKNVLLSDDTTYTIKALKSLGVSIEQNKTTLTITGSKGKLTAPKTPIFLGNSGTTMRMLAAVCSLAQGTTTLTGEKRLCERPMKDLLTALNDLGIDAKSENNNDCPPVVISGGELQGGTVHINGSISSQYITALLLIAPFAKTPMHIVVKGNLASKPYVALTLDLMQTFGVIVTNNNFTEFFVPNTQTYTAIEYMVEGDYSSASYFLAAAAVTNSKITVTNLRKDSSQGDKILTDFLQQMGCQIEKKENEITLQGTDNLQGITVNMNNYPDIVQTLAVVGAYAKGETNITNIGHLKDKETDRLTAPVTELQKMGIKAAVKDDSLTITGGKPHGATIQTYNDHRMAMSFAIAGLDGGTIIENAEVVKKSYPNFWEDLKSIGAKIENI